MLFSISNKKVFYLYLALRFVLLLALSAVFIYVFIYRIKGYTIHEGWRTIWQWLVPLAIFDIFFTPSYFELNFKEKHLEVHYSHKAYSHWLFWLRKRKPTMTMEIPINEFNGYEISFKQAGFKKYLILYKNTKGEILKSSPIPIHLVSLKHYTHMIIQLDKLTHQIKIL